MTQVKKKLDAVFSLYIRHKYADWKGYVACVSCGTVKQIKEMQCGHYVSRSHLSTRWDENNCFPQCVGCNVFKNGNYPAFTAYLLKEKGEEFVMGLVAKGNETKKTSLTDMQEMLEEYKKKLKEVL